MTSFRFRTETNDDLVEEEPSFSLGELSERVSSHRVPPRLLRWVILECELERGEEEEEVLVIVEEQDADGES